MCKMSQTEVVAILLHEGFDIDTARDYYECGYPVMAGNIYNAQEIVEDANDWLAVREYVND